MFIVVEQWSYKPAWHALSVAQRQEFVQGVGQAVAQLAEQGVTTLGFGLNDAQTDHRAPFDFWAVWQCADAEASKTFLAAVLGSGWYELFEHKNMSGLLQSPANILGLHIAA